MKTADAWVVFNKYDDEECPRDVFPSFIDARGCADERNKEQGWERWDVMTFHTWASYFAYAAARAGETNERFNVQFGVRDIG